MTDELDHEIDGLLGMSRPLSPDAAHLARARARVDARIQADTPVARGLRRFALGTLGGGGMWVGLVGAAAAHKASAAAVAVSLVLGGTVEASGVGPAVRDAVHDAVVSESSEQGIDSQDADAQVEGAESAKNEDAPAAVVVQDDDVNGGLLSHVAPNGRFTLRGLLEAGGDTLLVDVGDGRIITVLTDDATHLVVPGDREATLDSLIGHEGSLVLVEGVCELDDEDVPTETCMASVVVLIGGGRANAGGPPDDPGAQGREHQPEGVGEQGQGTPPTDPGRPEGAGQGQGQPSEVPGAELPEAAGSAQPGGPPEGRPGDGDSD
jgi:hypothetical protein